MNILTDALPKSLIVDGKRYAIDTDFRSWIKIELLICNGDIPICDKLVRMLALCYRRLPDSMNSALDALLWFYGGGAVYGGGDISASASRTKPLYSFEQDAQYIFAAFMAQYKLNLARAKLHWWEFRAMLRDISPESRFYRIMEYRSMDLSHIKDAATKRFYRKMKQRYRLPDSRGGVLCEDDIAAAISI